MTRDGADAGASLLRDGSDVRRSEPGPPAGSRLPVPGLPGSGLAGSGVAGSGPAGSMLHAKAAAENFPVALRLLPARYRRHLMAVYGFARTADDIGDKAPAPDRLRLLAELEADLRRLYAAAHLLPAPDPEAAALAAEGAGDGERPRLPAVRALAATVTTCGVPIQPFLDLIEANRQDQVVARYRTFDDLLGYCRLSANPVGRVVLHVFGCFSPLRAELSDSICTALQLAEHWQDVAEDLRAGRIYLPLDDMARHGCAEQDLAAATAPPRVRALIAFEVGRARALLDAGAPLIGTLRGAPRAAVAGYVAGGRATLSAIAGADHDVLAATRRPGSVRTAAELLLAFARGR